MGTLIIIILFYFYSIFYSIFCMVHIAGFFGHLLCRNLFGVIAKPTPFKNNIGTQGVQELFFMKSEIGAFLELFTVMIWLI